MNNDHQVHPLNPKEEKLGEREARKIGWGETGDNRTEGAIRPLLKVSKVASVTES